MALTDNLLAYYKFQGNSTDEMGSFTGSDTGIDYSTSYGKIGQGALFNSTSDVINLPNTVVPQGSDFTISWWGYYNNAAGTMSVFDQYRAADGYPRLHIRVISSKIDVFLRNVSLVSAAGSSTGTFSSSTWVYLAVTRVGNTLTYYINGSSSGTLSVTGIIYDGCNDSVIGNWYGGGFNYNGYLDEMGIWSRGLSSSEISQLYNSGSGLQYPFSGGATVLPKQLGTLQVGN